MFRLRNSVQAVALGVILAVCVQEAAAAKGSPKTGMDKVTCGGRMAGGRVIVELEDMGRNPLT